MSILLYAGGKKRTIKQLFVNIWNKVHDWWMRFESKHLWIARFIVYSTCLAVVFLLCCILFCYFNLFHTDVTSARYMLSALVQSQAAIVAIVITLTLIAVQLTASAYSPRVIDIFKKNPDMWILLGCYGVSIFYGFIVLKLVEGAEGEFVSQSAIWSLGPISVSFEFCVSLAYWLGAFTFVALFPYMWNIISLLKSENVIKRLANKITRDKILNHIKFAKTSEGVKTSTVDDPIQPIMDIIHGSIMKYDIATTRIGLGAVADQVIEIIDSDGEEVISESFCDHLMRVSSLTVSKMDEESTIEVIENLENFGKSTTDKKLEGATKQVAMSLREIGEAAAKIGLEGATGRAAKSLEVVGKAAVEKRFGVATWQVLNSLGGIGETATKKGFEVAASVVQTSLNVVGIAAAITGLEGATSKAAWSLGVIGEAAVEKGLEYATQQALNSLEGIGIVAVEKGLEDAAKQALKSLGGVGEVAAGKGLGDATDATREAAWSLGVVGIAAVEKRFGAVTWQAAWSLGAVGRIAAEKGFGDATSRVVWSLEAVGIASVEKGLEDATRQAAESLAELTILSEEIVKTAIQIYELKLKKQDRDAFKKFIKIYEQELEKLRAKKNSE